MRKEFWVKAKNLICENKLLKIASVLLAIVLWLLVINIDDPQTTATIESIPVRVMHDDVIALNGQVYDIASGDTVDIKITGPRTIVDSLEADDFTATADFRDLSKTNAVPIVVAINNSSYESKITISSKSENAMRLEVEDVSEKEYSLVVQHNNNVAEGYVVFSAQAIIDKITVTAPVSVQDKISKVAVSISFTGEEKDEFVTRGNVVIYDAYGAVIDQEKNHITLSEQYIKVTGVAYYKKTVDVKYELVDKLSDNKMLVGHKPSVEKITIVGSQSTVAQINEIVVPKDLTIVTDEVENISIDLKTLLPTGTYMFSENSVLDIEIKTEEVGVKFFDIQITDIGIKKIPDGYEASIKNKGSIRISVRGKESELEKLDATEISSGVYVDLSAALEGENAVILGITLPEGIQLVQNTYITVVLTESVEETEPTTQDKETETQESGTTEETTTSEADSKDGENNTIEPSLENEG